MSKNTNSNMHHITVHKAKKPWYKRFWVWALIIFVILCIGAAGSGDNNKNTATTSKPEASTPAPAPEQPKWDAAVAYDKVQTGMTKAEVETATGKPSKNCSESSIEGYGTTESCTYSGGFGDRGSIIVIYSNGAVQSKSKMDF